MNAHRWWKEVVVYQVYPRSFADSDGDGVGDLPGLTSKLDYLADLGVDVLWLSPIFASPNDDNGYDISDYRSIMTEFGTMAAFDELLAEVHAKGMRLVLDLVVNHTSDEHPWFVESRRSKDSAKRDWYIWRPAREDGVRREPNNWASYFSPSAWEYDEATDEYYLHLFSRKQPDLNWKNPAVRREVFDMMHFWLGKGIDGFRMDVINFLAKPPGLPDAPRTALNELTERSPRYIFPAGLIANQPGMHEILQEMNQTVLSHYDVMSVGECHFITAEDAVDYVEPSRKELDMVFQFDTLRAEGSIEGLKRSVLHWYDTLKGGGHNTISFANHDVPRQVSRFVGTKADKDPAVRIPAAKLLNTAVLTLPGTPFLYQGDELGMTNVELPSIEHHQDIETIHRYERELEAGRSPDEALALVGPVSRDNARTPMQWSAEANAGFTSGTPWLDVNPNYREINVERALQDPESVLSYTRRLLSLRRQTDALVYGAYEPVETAAATLYVFDRALEGRRVRVSLNFAESEAAPPEAPIGEILLSNYSEPAADGRLRAWEARIEALSD